MHPYIKQVYVPLVSLLENSLVLTVVLLGAFLVANGGMAGSDLTAFYFYSTTITAAMQVGAYGLLCIYMPCTTADRQSTNPSPPIS